MKYAIKYVKKSGVLRYIMAINAEEEMENDALSIFDVEKSDSDR
jgi:hypothetical protein